MYLFNIFHTARRHFVQNENVLFGRLAVDTQAALTASADIDPQERWHAVGCNVPMTELEIYLTEMVSLESISDGYRHLGVETWMTSDFYQEGQLSRLRGEYSKLMSQLQTAMGFLAGHMVSSQLDSRIDMELVATVQFAIMKLLFFEWAIIWHGTIGRPSDSRQFDAQLEQFKWKITVADSMRSGLRASEVITSSSKKLARSAQGTEFALLVTDLFDSDRESDGYWALRHFATQWIVGPGPM